MISQQYNYIDYMWPNYYHDMDIYVHTYFIIRPVSNVEL